MEASDAAAAPARARLVPGALPWPAVRGARLLRLLTPGGGPADAPDGPADEPRLGLELELCVSSPGHVALVLTRRAADAADVAPRVVYVLDAVPPKSAAASARGGQASDPAIAPAAAKASLASSASSASSSSSATPPTKPKSARFVAPLSPQDADEVELVEELLAAPRAAGGDGAVLAKAPLLCARFDCRVVGLRFVGAELPAASSAAGAPLRCVAAREDGLAFLWEWRADLHQWTFMNRFCFLENPNLAWTKPVVAFTATQSAEQPGRRAGAALGAASARLGRAGASGFGAGDGEEEAGGPMDISWWSTEAKQEPKLWQRSLRFVRETNTFRTDVVVGSAHAILPSEVTDASTLLPSKLGLWALSATAGVFFRRASLLSTLSISWEAATADPLSDSDCVSSTLEEVVVSPHNVTGELLVVQRDSGAVFLVSPPDASVSQLRSKKLTTLSPWQGGGGDQDVKEIAGHRHLLVALTHRPDGSEVLYVHSLVTGKRLETLALPRVSLAMPPSLVSASAMSASGTSDGPSAPLQLWTQAGKASAVGLWSRSSFWTLRLPTAKQVAAAHQLEQQNPAAAFVAVKSYGESSRLDAALFALDSLEQAVAFVGSRAEQDGPACRVDDSDPKWQAAVASMSNPALLLALLTSGSRRMPTALVDELAALVSAVNDAANELAVSSRDALMRKSSSRGGDRGGQTDDDGDKGIDKEVVLAAGRRLVTPANLESLKHLANWILLAKRKVASLQSPAFGDDKTPSTELQRARVQGADADEDQDASNFRLSRKLRPMSNLRFAAQSCALGAHGKQWLAQLEAFLLANVPFKKNEQGGQRRDVGMPNHLLFHEERVLDDYARHGGAPSFSKHMYLESMARLYLLHEPASLVAFVECVERFCPRLFSLAGRANVAKSHAERALALLPPAALFVARVQKSVGAETEAARASLDAYVSLLCHCGQWVEATRALLDCDLYERCKSLVLAPLVARNAVGEAKRKEEQQSAIVAEDEELRADRQAAATSVYLALVEHCVRRHYGADELVSLVSSKPQHVATLTLLRALRGWLETAAGAGEGGGGSVAPVTVGKLRSVLSGLLAASTTSGVR